MTATRRTIAIVGNPNSGKSTVFNGLTGSDQRVGNWPGVTVERREGDVRLGDARVPLVDLPGIYALLASSEDERIARDYVLGGEPALLVDVVDATNLERNLFLTTQLLELRVPMVVVLTMHDRATAKGITIDTERLAARLGCPLVAIDATDARDIERARSVVETTWGRRVASTTVIEQSAAIEAFVEAWTARLEAVAADLGVNQRWLALDLLERDERVTEHAVASGVTTRQELERAIDGLETELDESVDIALAEARYRFVEQVTSETLARPPATRSAGERIDGIVLHRLLGIPIFLGLMYLLFWFAISVGGAFVDFFDLAGGAVFVDGFGALLAGLGAPAWVIAVLANGVGAGLQTVVTFIPIVLAMFLGLAVLEDSGYMARAAFVMDRFMRAIGLPGKSFVPMLIGFGCNVPAIMATRTLENRRDRYLTIFMNPFMSCGARLPVYALFGAAFFGAAAGGMTFALYGVGIVAAILTGLLLKRTLFRGEPSYFIMELPPYHRPRLGATVRSATQRLLSFMTRAKFIVPIVTLLAVLNSMGMNGTMGNEDTPDSLLSAIGRGITPVFTPMGIEQENWPATVGIVTGVLAKETVVGTLNALYSQDAAAGGADAAAGETGEAAGVGAAGFDLVAALGDALATIPANLAALPAAFTDPFGFGAVGGSGGAVAEEVGTTASMFAGLRGGFDQGQPQAFAYLLFVLLYVPCVATFAAMTREMGLRYTLLAVLHIAVVAWSAAVLFYQLTVAHDLAWIAVALGLLAANVALFWGIGVRERSQRGPVRAAADLSPVAAR